MRSQGTKETQGINGDAANLQRALDGALAAPLMGIDARLGEAAPCSYRRHRGSDWRLTADHPLVCGVCHPPARGLEVSHA